MPEPTVTLFLRIPVSLRAALGAHAGKRAPDWRRPNVQAACIELLTTALAEQATPPAKAPRVVKGPQLALPATTTKRRKAGAK